MAAKVDLTGRSEPAQAITVGFFYCKSCFGKIILLCDILHQIIGNPPVHDTYSGLVSGKKLVGKGIDNILFHVYDLLIAKVIDIIIYQYNAKGAETARREGYFLSNQLQSFIILSNYRKKVFLQRR